MRTEMTLMSEAVLVGRMRDIYRRRLQQILGEIRLRDESGNIIVSPGLKVRQSKSGFEYTVDSVDEDPGSRQVMITLRKPEVPRFDPPGEEFVGESGAPIPDDIGDSDATHVDRLMSKFGNSMSGSDLDGESSVTFVINQEEFEDDYELEPSDSNEKREKESSPDSKKSPGPVSKKKNSTSGKTKNSGKGSKR